MQLGVKILSKMRRPAITEDEYTVQKKKTNNFQIMMFYYLDDWCE